MAVQDIITCAEIEAMEPCYDPVPFFEEWGSNTITRIEALDFAGAGDMEKIWVVARFCSEKVKRTLAVFMAYQYLEGKGVPEEIIDGLEMAEILEDGEVDDVELANLRTQLTELYDEANENQDSELAHCYDVANISLGEAASVVPIASLTMFEGAVDKLKELIIQEQEL